MDHTRQHQTLKQFKTIISFTGAYIIAGLLIITIGGAWTSDVKIALDQERLKWSILALTILETILLLCLNFMQKLELSNIGKRKLFIALLSMVTYMYQFNGNFQNYLGYFFLQLVWFVVLFICIEKKEILWEAFINLTVLIAIVSLIFYLGGTCLRIIPESSITELDWGVWDTSSIRNYYNLYYQAQFLKIGGGLSMIPRNCGIFSEAPMYNFVLCIAVAAELFLAKKVYRWKVAVLVLTIITTLTTTGYIFLIVMVLIYMANIVFYEKGITIHKIAMICISALGILGVFAIFIHKMTSVSGAGSFNVRSDHLFACLRAWMESPILGLGFENQDAVLEFAIHKQGISVGFAYLLATGGILLTSILIIPYIFNGIMAIKKRNYNELCFESLFLILYFFTAITTYPVLVFYMSYIIITDCKSESEEDRTDPIRMFIVKILRKTQCSVQDFSLYIRKKIKAILLICIAFSIIISALLLVAGLVSLKWIFLYGVVSFIGSIVLSILICYLCCIFKYRSNIEY